MSYREWLLIIIIFGVALFAGYGWNLQYSYEASLWQIITIILLCFTSGCVIGWLLTWSWTKAKQPLTTSILDMYKEIEKEDETKEGNKDGEVR